MPEGFRFYVGVDWGAANHQVCWVDPAGTALENFPVAHNPSAVRELIARLLALAPAASIAVAIESPASPVTAPLLEAGLTVFSINPKQLDRFRDRFFPSGAKDDRRDSYVLATSLRTDLGRYRRLSAADPDHAELRSLLRLEETVKADLRAYSSRLRDLLLGGFPQLLGLCNGADEAWLWDLLTLAPVPPSAARLSLARLSGLLRRHRIRRVGAAELRALLRQPALPLPPASFQRIGREIGLLLPILLSLRRQQGEIAAHFEALMLRLTAAETGAEGSGQHRDLNIILSLPGVGNNVAATMLTEAPEALARRDYNALRAHAGVAPVTRQSGKSRLASMRRACCGRLRNAVYHWSRVSSICDPRSRQHYLRLRARGHSHGRALRGVADRLLRLLCALLRNQTEYDPARHPVLPESAAA